MARTEIKDGISSVKPRKHHYEQKPPKLPSIELANLLNQILTASIMHLAAMGERIPNAVNKYHAKLKALLPRQ